MVLVSKSQVWASHIRSIEDACGVSSPLPHATCRSCVSIGKIVAMISAVNSSTRGAEAEPAEAEDDAEAEAEAGRVHGGYNCNQFRADAQKLALSEKCLQSLSP